MSPKKHELDRRTFLRGMGVCLALPFLEAMIPSVARAATTDMRFLWVYYPNGQWSNKSGLPDYLKQVLDTTTNMCGRNIPGTPNLYSVVSGLSNRAVVGDQQELYARRYPGGIDGAHGGASVCFMSCKTAPPKAAEDQYSVQKTYDQYIVDALKSKTPNPYFHLNIRGRDSRLGVGDPGKYLQIYGQNLSWLGPDKPSNTYSQVLDAFNAIFSSGIPQTQVDQTTQLRLQKKKSILDFVLADTKSLSARLGQSDRARLDEYLTGLEDIERRVVASLNAESGNMPVAACNPNADVPGSTKPFPPTSNINFVRADNYQGLIDIHHDLIVKAFECDLVRSAGLMHANTSGAGLVMDWLGHTEQWHTYSHWRDNEPVYKPRFMDAARYQYEMFKRLIHKLRAVQDPMGNTLFDNTLITFGAMMGTLGDVHSQNNMYQVVSGGAKGQLKLGQTFHHTNLIPLANLWLTYINAFRSDMNSFGNSTGKIAIFK